MKSGPPQALMEQWCRDDPQKLADLILTEDNRITMTFAASAARGTKHEPLITAMLTLLEHPLAWVREGAVMGLRGSDDPRARPAIETIAEFDPHEDVRDVAQESLDDWY